MKIFVLIIVIFAINGYLTNATSIDPLENVEMDNAKIDSDDTRTKRSGDIFSALLKKKLGLLSSLSGSSSGKSIHPDHFEEPLSYHTKSFNLWGVKKALLSSVLQAAKAITGGVIALKGQLIKVKGHAVVAKGKLMQTKGEAISNFGKNIATHAFDVHHQPHLDVGLYNHLPITPIHQPTSYGVAGALAYQGQSYPSHAYSGQPLPTGHGYSNNVYPSHGYPNQAYPVGAASYQTGYVGTQPGYDGGVDYAGYGGNSLTAKRAVMNVAQESNINQVKSDLQTDSVRAGLLIFKPIGTAQNSGSPSFQNIQNIINNRPSSLPSVIPAKTSQPIGYQNSFPGLKSQQSSGYQLSQSGEYQGSQVGGYQVAQTNVYSSNPSYLTQSSNYPTTGVGSNDSGERNLGQGSRNYNFQQAVNSQGLNRQLSGFSGQQQSYSQENYSGEQSESASDSDERVAQPSYKLVQHAELPKHTAATTKSNYFSTDFFLPTTGKYSDDQLTYATKKRNAPSFEDLATISSSQDIVPLKYHNDSNEEEQSRLKQTVQRFFSMLQKQRCKYW